MEIIIHFLYGISAIGFILAGIPQIVQILKTKTVEGISLQMYDMWLMLQIFAFPYVLQSRNVMWIISSALWIVYYAVMVALIKHYRYPRYVQNAVQHFVAILRLLPHHA